MSTRRTASLILGPSAVVALGLGCFAVYDAAASDHNEPQGVNIFAADGSTRNGTLSSAGDIYGLYSWYNRHTDNIAIILSMPAPVYGFGAAPPQAGAEYDGENPAASEYGAGAPTPWDESAPNAYDPKVIYAIHLDRDFAAFASQVLADAEINIYAQFGYNAQARQWAVKLIGLPGESGPVVVPVNVSETLPSGTQVHAGLFDDPFFFDLDGFFGGLEPRNQVQATLRFNPDNDVLAGRNSRAIVLEIPRRRIMTGIHNFNRRLNVWADTATAQ